MFLPSPVLGMDEMRPTFQWAVPRSTQGARVTPLEAQSSFRVNVTTSPTGTGVPSQLVWTSGVVDSGPSTGPSYRPKTPLPLKSDTAYSWTVEVSQQKGLVSPSASQPARFVTGLLQQEDWAPARWLEAGRCTPPAMIEHTAQAFGNCSGGLLTKDFTVPTDAASTAAASVGRISIFVGACQYYELYLDGRRIGDRELDVAWTRFDLNRTYASHELQADRLQPTLAPGSKHALGLLVGQGFCGEAWAAPNGTGTRQAILRMTLHSSKDDSPLLVVGTDGSWSSGQSPYAYESTYNGEDYRAGWEQPGWATAGFIPPADPPAPWSPAKPVAGGGAPGSPGQPWMQAQLQQPMRAVHEIRPLSARRVLKTPGAPEPATPARWTFDFGQEFSGHVRMTLPAGVPPGTTITLSHTEVLGHPQLKQVVNGQYSNITAQYDGSAYTGNLFWARPIDAYRTGNETTANGSAVYETRFSFHGFRYVELGADPPLPDDVAALIGPGTLVGINVRTDAAEQASVAIANPVLQRIYSNAWWTEASGLMGIPSGAAGRGERGGWTGDAAIASEQELFDFDTGAVFTQYLEQIQDLACRADGTIPHSIPMGDPGRSHMGDWNDPFTCENISDDPSWNTVFPTILWNVWRYNNATGAVEQHYPLLLQFMATLQASVQASGLAKIYCLWGDHQSLAHTPCQVTASASYIRDLRYAADLSYAIGRSSEAAAFASQAEGALADFTAAFWDSATGKCSVGTQTAQAIALWLGAVPAAQRRSVADALAAELLQNGVTVGFLGASYVFEALVWANRTDAAVQALLRTEYPGYGYQVYNPFEPSTSLWESWNGDSVRQWVAESSRSHHYQTNIASFLRKHVAGLDMAMSSQWGLPQVTQAGSAHASYNQTAHGWSVVRARPEAALLQGDLGAAVPGAQASVTTARGLVAVGWRRVPGGLEMNVTVPLTSTAEAHVPLGADAGATIRESGAVVWRDGAFVPGGAPGVVGGRREGDFVVLDTLSGAYAFEAVQ